MHLWAQVDLRFNKFVIIQLNFHLLKFFNNLHPYHIDIDNIGSIVKILNIQASSSIVNVTLLGALYIQIIG
jgi:hypothetical protein